MGRRPRFFTAASSVALLLLAASLGRCDAKRTLKVVSILVSDRIDDPFIHPLRLSLARLVSPRGTRI